MTPLMPWVGGACVGRVRGGTMVNGVVSSSSMVSTSSVG